MSYRDTLGGWHRVPELPEWIKGIEESYYPRRCRNCYNFPTVLVKFNDVSRRVCPFCRVHQTEDKI